MATFLTIFTAAATGSTGSSMSAFKAMIGTLCLMSKPVLLHRPHPFAGKGFADKCCVASSSVRCRRGCERLLECVISAGDREPLASKELSNLGVRRDVDNVHAVTCARQDLSTTDRVEAGKDQLQFTHEVSVDIAAPVDLVWCMWTDLPNAPSWMRWIDRVELLEDSTTKNCTAKGLSSLSRWICSTRGFEVSWVAQIDNIEVTPPRRFLRWATISGLQSVGEVSFTESSQGTRVELKIGHAVPQSLGQLMTWEALKSLIEATLQSDLERFHQYTLAALGTVNLSN